MGDSTTGWDDAGDEVEPPDPRVTRELFLEWRSPRFGSSNPQPMNNPVWEWFVKTRIDPYQAAVRFKGPSAFGAGPGWCFARYGQSSNQLPNGSVVFIAGEHEDYYDPDFRIYNDVVIQHPDGRIDIFGYPRELFPPTDFHSATLVENKIILIGNLGYPDERRPGCTQVLILDLESWAISTRQTTGTQPGWIHAHVATLSDDLRSILVQRGKLELGDGQSSLVENIDDWRLNLDDWRWERLTERQWPRCEVRRKDDQRNHLFEYQQAVWGKRISEFQQSELGRLLSESLTTLQAELGMPPNLDLFEQLYNPAVPHEELPISEDEFAIHRIKVDGVIVRYVEEMHSIQITVEGELPNETLDILSRDVVDKLSATENAPCELVRL